MSNPTRIIHGTRVHTARVKTVTMAYGACAAPVLLPRCGPSRFTG